METASPNDDCCVFALNGIAIMHKFSPNPESRNRSRTRVRTFEEVGLPEPFADDSDGWSRTKNSSIPMPLVVL